MVGMFRNSSTPKITLPQPSRPERWELVGSAFTLFLEPSILKFEDVSLTPGSITLMQKKKKYSPALE